MSSYSPNKLIIPPVSIPDWLVSDSRGWQTDIERSLVDNVVYRPPLFASIVITSKCNASCIYCPYGSHGYQDKQNDISLLNLFSVVDELAEIGVRRVQFAGGEPLLMDWLESLVSYANMRGLETSLVTNGLCLDRKRYKGLVKAGLKALVISCDDLPMFNDTNLRGMAFPEAIKWVKEITPEHVWLGANITLTANNQDRIIAIAKLLTGYGFSPQVQPLHLFDETPLAIPHLPDADKLKIQVVEWITLQVLNNSPYYLNKIPFSLDGGKSRQPIQCLIPWKHILIDSLGNISFCCRTGNIGHINTGVLTAWQGVSASQIRAITNQGCRECWLGLVDFWK
jgi:MoaA/NifB/PqqE/SkfB family radical SAM enzyme